MTAFFLTNTIFIKSGIRYLNKVAALLVLLKQMPTFPVVQWSEVGLLNTYIAQETVLSTDCINPQGDLPKSNGNPLGSEEGAGAPGAICRASLTITSTLQQLTGLIHSLPHLGGSGTPAGEISAYLPLLLGKYRGYI